MAPNKKSRGTATLIDATRFHFVDPLRLETSPAKSHEWDDALVREALQRGASEFDVMERLERRRIREETARTSMGVEPLGWPADFSVVHEALAALRNIAQQEFASLSPWVQESFKYDINEKALAAKAARRPPEPAWPPLDYYILMRAALYQHGYNDPAEAVFHRITQATLLGQKIIGGVHLNFADSLQSLEQRLERLSPGLAGRVAKDITSVAGFVPRFQALKHGKKGPPALSNHALGLAIDIDFVSNPHIKEPAVVAAMREITGVDFGKPFLQYSTDMPPVERAKEIHRIGKQASDAVQQWLKKWLPTYLELEGRKKTKASFPEAVLDSETDRNLGLLRTVIKHHELWQVKVWMENGIQSIPVELAAGLEEIGFRWGSTYERHKDAMHFELLPEKVLPPDVKKKRPPDEVLQMIAP